MHLNAYEHPYHFVLPEERTEFEVQMTSQYMILVKISRHLPDLKTFTLDLCYYYFVDVMLAREGLNAADMDQEEYAYHIKRFKNHPDVPRYFDDIMTFFVLARYTNETLTNKGGSYTCIARYTK